MIAQSRRRFIWFIIIGLFVFLPNDLFAQEETETPIVPTPIIIPTSTVTVTPAHTSTSTSTPTATSTNTATSSPAPEVTNNVSEPTLDVINTEQVEVTEVSAPEVQAEVTEVVVPEAEAEVTENVDPTPEQTQAVLQPEPEPELTAIVSEPFLADTTIDWTLGDGWQLVPLDGNYALQSNGIAQATSYSQSTFSDVAVEALVQSQDMTVELHLRESELGSYYLSLSPDGTVAIYKNDLALASTMVTSNIPNQWRQIRFSAIGHTLRASVDDVEILVITDAQPLSGGDISFSTKASSTVINPILLLDNVRIWIPNTDLAGATPTVTSAPVISSSPTDLITVIEEDENWIVEQIGDTITYRPLSLDTIQQSSFSANENNTVSRGFAINFDGADSIGSSYFGLDGRTDIELGIIRCRIPDDYSFQACIRYQQPSTSSTEVSLSISVEVDLLQATGETWDLTNLSYTPRWNRDPYYTDIITSHRTLIQYFGSDDSVNPIQTSGCITEVPGFRCRFIGRLGLPDNVARIVFTNSIEGTFDPQDYNLYLLTLDEIYFYGSAHVVSPTPTVSPPTPTANVIQVSNPTVQSNSQFGLSSLSFEASAIEDPGDNICTLREAIEWVNNENGILPTSGVIDPECEPTLTDNSLASGEYALDLYAVNYQFATALPPIHNNIVLRTIGSSLGTHATIERLESAPAFRIFEVASTGVLTLENIIVSNGVAPNGGGIFNDGTLFLSNSAVISNEATMSGGGIYNTINGAVTIVDSIIANNIAINYHAVQNANANGGVNITNSCINQNSNPTYPQSYAVGGQPISAALNWWGDSAGPSINGTTNGDLIEDSSVTFNNSWLMSPPILGLPIECFSGVVIRDVPVESQLFHDHAAEIGLPLPFDILPVNASDVAYTNGYGATTFAYQNQDIYDGTNYIHTGIDYMPKSSNIQVFAICDGVVFRGQKGIALLGSTSRNTGYGISLRCFANDPLYRDAQNGGELSNIMVVYNHLALPNIASGQIVSEGQLLATTSQYWACPTNGSDPNCIASNAGTTCVDQNGSSCPRTSPYYGYDHLHLEMFIARGFRDGEGSNAGGPDAIRINPLLMYSTAIVEQHVHVNGLDMRAYYPAQSYSGSLIIDSNGLPVPNSPLIADIPWDTTNDVDDIDFGILFGDLTRWSVHGEFYGLPNGSGQNINMWTRQATSSSGIQVFGNTPQTDPSPGAEWASGQVFAENTTTTLLNLLMDNTFRTNNGYPTDGTPYIGPYCNAVETTTLGIYECDSITNDDTGQDLIISGR